jgi:hypothetical protein
MDVSCSVCPHLRVVGADFDNYNKMVQLYAQQATCFSVS